MAYKSPKPLPTREPAGQGGGPWEKGQQQERGTQHTGLATVNVHGPGAEAPAQAALGTSRWAGGPVLGWATTSGDRERGWQTEGTPEPLPKDCRGLRAPLPRDLQLLGGGGGGWQVSLHTVCLLLGNSPQTPPTSPNPASVSPRCRDLIYQDGTAPPSPYSPRSHSLQPFPPPQSQATPCQGPGHTTDSVEEKGGVLFSSV